MSKVFAFIFAVTLVTDSATTYKLAKVLPNCHRCELDLSLRLGTSATFPIHPTTNRSNLRVSNFTYLCVWDTYNFSSATIHQEINSGPKNRAQCCIANLHALNSSHQAIQKNPPSKLQQNKIRIAPCPISTLLKHGQLATRAKLSTFLKHPYHLPSKPTLFLHSHPPNLPLTSHKVVTYPHYSPTSALPHPHTPIAQPQPYLSHTLATQASLQLLMTRGHHMVTLAPFLCCWLLWKALCHAWC